MSQAALQEQAVWGEEDVLPVSLEEDVSPVSLEEDVSPVSLEESVSQVSPEEENVTQVDSEEDVTQVSSGEEGAVQAAASEGEGVTQVVSLEDYDLVYVNGTLSAESAARILDAGIPVILNQDKVTGLQDVLEGYQKEGLAHFVNQRLYFFKNEDGSPSHLLNLQFHTPIKGVKEDGTIQDDSPAAGFSEILEYIDSENEYRKVVHTETGDGESYLLSQEISQARAVEYILNYQYRRNVMKKDVVRVLDIEPAKNGSTVADVSEGDVYQWLGLLNPMDNKNISSIEACHNNNFKENVTKLVDGNRNNYWQTGLIHNFQVEDKDKDDLDGDGDKEENIGHWVKLTLHTPVSLSGLVYTPRQTGEWGLFTAFDVILVDTNNKRSFYEYNEITYPDRSDKIFRFDQVHENIKYVYIVNIKGSKTDQHKGKDASGAELALLTDPLPKVEITAMTSSEFVGNIQDLNAMYDIIYWGAKGRSNQGPKPALLAKLINGDGDTMLYTHVGGASKPTDNCLMGVLESDYENSKVKKMDDGSIRGSGNDITGQQVEALLEFARSGYPLIVSDKLYKDGSIDKDKVDHSSYVYEFLDKLEKLKETYPNICKRSEAETKDMTFFADLPKPVIQFTEMGMPPSAIGGENGPSDKYIENNLLRYEFSIQDEAQTSAVNATYHCELFLDLNSDGNFSSTERLEDIQVSGEDGIVLTKNQDGKYELKLGKTYKITREIPETYHKLITWKLKVSDNARPQIWTTQKGYTRSRRSEGEEKPEIQVLQISPKDDDTRGKETWKLDKHKAFQFLLQKVDEYEIKITRLTAQQYVDAYKNDPKLLDQYDMLILGFRDRYTDISNDKPKPQTDEDGNMVQPPGAVDAIVNFIEDGKSVLFAHDTTSYNCDRTKKEWGHSFNYILRPLLGMDRYGVIAKDTEEIIKRGLNGGSLTAGTDLWKSVYLAQNLFREDGSYLRSNGDMAYQSDTTKPPRTATYWQTQGFSNMLDKPNWCNNAVTASQVNEGAITEYPYEIPENMAVSWTHKQYFQLAMEEDADQDGTNDIIVWYCLSGGVQSGEYDSSPNDVRNYYYLYSKGNVMYTGVGHGYANEDPQKDYSVKDTDKAPGEITMTDVNELPNANELKLFVNAIVASYRASAVSPKIQFVNGFSRTAEEITSTYYITDQYMKSDGETNVVDNTKEFCFKVDDHNLVASSSFDENVRTMDLELYIESGDGTDKKKEPIIVPLDEDEPGNRVFQAGNHYKVKSGSVYSFSLSELEKYVQDPLTGKYRNDVRIFAKVTTSFMLYGRKVEGSGTAEISLRQRQMFDLD